MNQVLLTNFVFLIFFKNLENLKGNFPRGIHMKERIAVNPNIHFGKPCVAGTRITVQNVLELLKEAIDY